MIETENVKTIGDYNGVPVYFDKNSSNPNLFYLARGPIPEHMNRNNVGLVWMNWETGKCTIANGEPYIAEKVDYEDKGYFVGIENIEEAKIIITKGLEQRYGTK